MRMNFSYFFTATALALVLTAFSVQAQAPSITNGPPPSQAGLNTNPTTSTNAPYNFTYTVSGFTQTPAFSVTAGSLPSGLSLSTAGVISGMPLSADVGTTYTGTVTASDGVDTPATQNFSITVVTTLLNTVPEGVVNVSFPAATTTYLSVPFTADPFYRGVVSSVIAVTANTIAVDDSPAPWTAQQFVVPAGGNSGTAAMPYFVKILSGNEMGRVLLITANTTNSLTLDTTDNNNGATVSLTTTTPTAFNIQAGDAFEIFPADTLASVFGEYTTQAATWTGTTTEVTLSDSNSAIQVGATVTGTGIAASTTVTAVSGTSLTLSKATTASETGVTLTFSGAAQLILTPGTAYSNADVVNIYNPISLKFQSYFFDTTVGYWVLKGSTVNANNTILYPYGALAVFRRVATALSFSMTGRVAEVPVLTKVGTDTVAYGSSGYAVPLTLSQIDLGSNWLTSSTYGSADILSLYSPTLLKFVSYFQLPDSTSWRTKTSATDVGDTITVAPGEVVVLFQRGSVSGAEFFLSPAMPYTLSYTNF